MNMVDTSGWLEFFLAGTNGPKFKPVIENTRELLVPSVNMYVVHRVLSRKLPVELRDMCLEVMRRAPVIELNDERAIAASQLSLKHGLAMADAAMYAIAHTPLGRIANAVRDNPERAEFIGLESAGIRFERDLGIRRERQQGAHIAEQSIQRRGA